MLKVGIGYDEEKVLEQSVTVNSETVKKPIRTELLMHKEENFPTWKDVLYRYRAKVKYG